MRAEYVPWIIIAITACGMVAVVAAYVYHIRKMYHLFVSAVFDELRAIVRTEMGAIERDPRGRNPEDPAATERG